MALTKFVGFIIDIESFEQNIFIIKGLLQSYRLKQNLVTIGIYLLISNKVKCKYQESMQIYWKCGDEQQYKSVIEASMVSTPEKFTNNSTMSPRPSVTVRNPSARKSLRIFTEVLDVKNKTSV